MLVSCSVSQVLLLLLTKMAYMLLDIFGIQSDSLAMEKIIVVATITACSIKNY